MTALRLREVGSAVLRLRIESNVAGLEAGQRALSEFLGAQGASERGVYLTELAFDELGSNIIKYAYADGPSPSRLIDIHVEVPGDEILFTIEDEGPPFNPLEEMEPPAPDDPTARQIGGLGLVLVRMAAATANYQRLDGRNRVSLRIKPRV